MARRFVQRGKLVTISTWNWKRFLGVTLVAFVLVGTNPACTERRRRGRRWTNFGVATVEQQQGNNNEDGHIMLLHAATFTWELCHFREYIVRDSAVWAEDWCKQVVAEQVAHEKALWYDPHDDAHTLHRSVVWIAVFVNLLLFCRNYVPFGNVWLEGLSQLCVAVPHQLLASLLWTVLHANFSLQQVWPVLVRTSSSQDRESVLAAFDDVLLDSCLTATVLVMLAWAVNILGHYLTGRYLLRFTGLVAVFLGYARTVQKGGGISLGSSYQTFFPFLPSFISNQAWTWSMVALAFVQRSPLAAIAFLVSNLVGAAVGDYHYLHQTGYVESKIWAMLGSLFGYS